jgi:hypothetical protein
VIAGRMVQINSINCPSKRYRLINLLKNNIVINCLTKIVIINKTNKVWSWKNESCSIRGDLLSWRSRVFHVAISKKRFFIYGV